MLPEIPPMWRDFPRRPDPEGGGVVRAQMATESILLKFSKGTRKGE